MPVTFWHQFRMQWTGLCQFKYIWSFFSTLLSCLPFRALAGTSVNSICISVFANATGFSSGKLGIIMLRAWNWEPKDPESLLVAAMISCKLLETFFWLLVFREDLQTPSLTKHTSNFEHVSSHIAFRGLRLWSPQSSASCVYFTGSRDIEAQQSLETIRQSNKSWVKMTCFEFLKQICRLWYGLLLLAPETRRSFWMKERFLSPAAVYFRLIPPFD